MEKQQQLELFLTRFFLESHKVQLANVNSSKVLINLAEFMMKENQIPLEGLVSLIGIGLPLGEKSKDLSFARLLYVLSHVMGSKKMYIRAEGLLNASMEIIADQLSFEKVEALYIQANLFNRIDNRREHVSGILELAKSESEKMPEWYPYLVSIYLPDFKLRFD